MSSATERAAVPPPRRAGPRRIRRPIAGPDPKLAGTLLCVPGLILLWLPSLFAAALGLELVAAAFWWWARAAVDPEHEIRRWAWLRRPAAALWLAGAIHAAMPALDRHLPGLRHSLDLWRQIDAIAVVWGGLELLAALPLARPYSDLPGPLLAIKPWLPVILPAAGFAVLWRQAPHWTGVPEVRTVSEILLLVTAVLATLRAFGRRRWTASLRWLVVADCALAVLLITVRAASPGLTLILWGAASGGHAFMLAGELRGAAPRRGATKSLLWRLATWSSSAALTWPALVTLFPTSADALRALDFPAAALATLLVAWINVGRIVEAPERRLMTRPDPLLTLGHLAALLVLITGPLAILASLWTGAVPPMNAAILAVVPALIGGALAIWASPRVAAEQRPASPGGPPVPVPPREAATGTPAHAGTAPRQLARAVFNVVVAVETFAVSMVDRAVRGVSAPLRDLTSGDAQDYLLFLIGLSVLALVLPLLRS